MLKVRIVKNSRGMDCWYADRIGETFMVETFYRNGKTTDDFITPEAGADYTVALIARRDVEVVLNPVNFTAAEMDAIVFSLRSVLNTGISKAMAAFPSFENDHKAPFHGAIEKLKKARRENG